MKTLLLLCLIVFAEILCKFDTYILLVCLSPFATINFHKSIYSINRLVKTSFILQHRMFAVTFANVSASQMSRKNCTRKLKRVQYLFYFVVFLFLKISVCLNCIKIYWAKVLTDHPKICDNWFVFKYFETNFGTLNQNAIWHQSCASAGTWRSSCSLRMGIHIKPLKCMCNSRKDLNLNSNHGNVNNNVFALK